jgi:outer membrane scaffolding protein for murein synthesis (MipA/OmpV family)
MYVSEQSYRPACCDNSVVEIESFINDLVCALAMHAVDGSFAGARTMGAKVLNIAIVAPQITVLILVLCACLPGMASAQTPSPLQEWQYPGGTILDKVFNPDQPDWHVVLGGAVASEPRYGGANVYRVSLAPVIDIRYRDIAFASVGEGLGVNIWHGDKSRAGIAIGYDLGRPVSDDYHHLRGLGDIAAAPVIKVFGSIVISKAFPLVLRADVRRIVGGGGGLLGDLEAFMPLPGSSRTFIMFAGPSVTFANRQYSQKVFGVSTTQALNSAYSVYNAHGGSQAVGLGFSATRFITPHWLINTDMAWNHLLGSAGDSPITQSAVQGILEFSTEYRW